MSADDAIDKMRQLGLTEYEVQAYVALVQGDQMSAEEVARKAGIPVPRVYGVLESLRNLGLIVILKGRPKKFEILSPAEGLQNLLKVRERAAEESLKQLEQTCQEVITVLSPIFWREQLRIRPEELLEPIDNLANTQKRTKELIKEAQESIEIFSDIFRWFEDIKPDLRNAMNRGVKIRVLMNKEHHTTKSTVRKLQEMGVSVRQPQNLRFPVRGTLIDASKVVFLIWASPSVGKKKPRYVYRPSFSSNEGIVAIFKQSFEYRWQQATT